MASVVARAYMMGCEVFAPSEVQGQSPSLIREAQSPEADSLFGLKRLKKGPNMPKFAFFLNFKAFKQPNIELLNHILTYIYIYFFPSGSKNEEATPPPSLFASM